MTETLASRLSAALSGRYAIERELGQGGMATVFLARDLRHDRKVALKVLKPELAAVIGAERFLQEIKVTAGLSHPHILPLHDSGEAEHFLYYVMPYVEGESLRDRLSRERQLALDDALRIATEVASALAYAHGRGVIHRDIKPENILLSHGAAVVADFGIARAVSAAGGGRLTETGLSLGTPQYMSPEQATADRELDGRSDVYALGCVLYEMLTGEPPHTGPTTQSVIAKLLTEAPRPVALGRPSVPRHVAAAVHKSLARLPADRFRGAADFADALARPGAIPADAEPDPTPLGALPVKRRRVLPLAGAAILLLAAGYVLARVLGPRAPDAAVPVVRSLLKLPPAAAIQPLPTGQLLTLSPDGTVLVYTGRQQLFMRRLDQLEPVPLPTSQGGQQPFFSPNGQRVGFTANGSLKHVALVGGPAVTVCPASSTTLAGASWGSRDLIVFSLAGKLFQVPAGGGVPREVSLADTTGNSVLRWPDFLPDGRRVLVTRGRAPGLETAVVDLESGTVTPVAGVGYSGHFVEPGSLVTFSNGTGSVTPFDWQHGRVAGPSSALLDGIQIGVTGVANIGVARNGWVVYPIMASLQRRLVLVDRRGTASPLATEARAFSDPRFSPDGRRIVVTSVSPAAGLAGDLWVLDLAQTTLARLSFGGREQFPEWTANGARVVYTSLTDPNGILSVPVNGGPADTLLRGVAGDLVLEGALSRDGLRILYRLGTIPADLYTVRRDSLSSPRALAATSFDERSPTLSPDEHWIAYVSDETGRDEVYVMGFPGGGDRKLVSAAGGSEPRWRRDGRELFYRNGDTLFAVQVPLQREFAPGPRSMLFTGNYLRNGRHTAYDVDPKGTRFIFVTGDLNSAGELILVQNLLARVVSR